MPAPTPPGGASERSDIRRILIATKFRFIGDTLLAIPIFRAARAQWPDAHIALLTGKNARVLLQNNPYLDEIIEFDPYKSRPGALRPTCELVRRLRAGPLRPVPGAQPLVPLGPDALAGRRRASGPASSRRGAGRC